MRTLQQWHWPGNVRELKNVVERSIYRWEFPNSEVDEIIIDPFISPFTAQDVAAPEAEPQRGSREPAPAEPRDFQQEVGDYERNLLVQSLELSSGHQGRAAERLGLSYDQMRGLLRKHGIRSRKPRASH
jgi:psp operon transcriptional activator